MIFNLNGNVESKLVLKWNKCANLNLKSTLGFLAGNKTQEYVDKTAKLLNFMIASKMIASNLNPLTV